MDAEDAFEECYYKPDNFIDIRNVDYCNDMDSLNYDVDSNFNDGLMAADCIVAAQSHVILHGTA